MTLIKWINRPTLMDEVSNWFDGLSIDSPISFYNKSTSWIPQFEFRQVDDSYQIFAELPGMNKKDVNIEAVDGTLIISGEKPQSDNDENKNHYSEISYGKFSRSFNLPEDIVPDKVSAKMKDGILAVYISRMEQVKPEVKKIAIK